MSKQYEITVLLAQYNPDYKKLIATIESILFQEQICFEIVICDDGSKEDYFDELKSYFKEKHFEDYQLVKLEPNGGTVKNVFNGIKYASGKYIKPISPGDYLYKNNTLNRIYRFMENNNARIAFGDVVSYQNTEQAIIRYQKELQRNKKLYDRKKYSSAKILKNMLLYWDFIIGASLVYERELLMKLIQRIYGKVKYAEDLALYIAVAEKERIYHMNFYIIWYEYGTGVSTSNNQFWLEQMAKDKDVVYELLYQEHPENRIIKKAYLNNANRFIKNKLKRYGKTILLCPDKIWYLLIARVSGLHKKDRKNVEFKYLIRYLGEKKDKRIELR